MSNETPLRWQEHYDFTCRIFDTAQNILKLPQVETALGEKSVFLSMALDSVRVRPVKNGVIEWSEDDTRSTIHAISLSSGQSIEIAQTGSNEHQYVFASMLYGDDEAKRLLLSEDSPISLVMDNNIAGVMTALTRVHSLADHKLFPLQMYVRGRPTIALNLQSRHSHTSQDLTMIHEIDHALNATIYPMYLATSDNDFYLRSELSAYSTQSIVARNIGVEDEGYLPHIIERIRRDFNGDISSSEAYRTDTGVAEKLEEVGLGDIHK